MDMHFIDSLSQLRLKSLTKADLAVTARTGSMVKEGESSPEAPEAPTSARLGVVCALGNLEAAVWRAACYHVAEQNGAKKDIEHLIGFFLSVMPGKEGQTVVQDMALESYVGERTKDPEWDFYEAFQAF